MEESNGEKKLLPPYLSYKTFSNFIEGLKVTTPARIDKSVMPSLSGANQSWLIGTLKYMKLMTEDGVPSVQLTKLAKAQNDERKKLLREILVSSYPFLFSEPFNLRSATPRQIEEEFNKTAATGDTVKRCIAFFLKAAKDAGIELSPYLQKMRYTKTTRTPRRNQITTEQIDNETAASSSRDWAAILVDKFPSLDPAWPDDVKAKWFDAFKQMMDMMKEHEQGQE